MLAWVAARQLSAISNQQSAFSQPVWLTAES
jgi:hypothetical protein